MNKTHEALKENLDKYLNDYLDLGYALYTFEIGNGKQVTIKTLTVKEQMEAIGLLKAMGENETAAEKIRKHHLDKLSRVLKSYGDKSFETPEAAMEFILSAGSVVIDRIGKEWESLESFFKKHLSAEDVENFTSAPSTDTAQN